jgi:threonine dehydratase
MSLPEPLLPTVGDIEAAAARLKGLAAVTPLLSSPALDRRVNARVLVKAECLQRTGSFKFRGAYNALSQLDPAARGRGVVAFSSGNHAQGVACAAALLEMRATIVMPSDAPRIKVAHTRAFGAEIVFYDRMSGDREAIARKIAAERGAELLAPFDDPRVIAGQGTAGREIGAQAAEMGARLDALVAPCSGGGLIGGIALALSAASPGTRIYAAEPEEFDDLRRSLAAGKRVANDPGGRSLCDALLASSPGQLTFALAQKYLAGSVAVSDAEVERAMAVAFDDLKLVAEPSGAAGLAAVLAGKLDVAGRTVAVVLSGGNVDRAAFAATLSAGR